MNKRKITGEDIIDRKIEELLLKVNKTNKKERFLNKKIVKIR